MTRMNSMTAAFSSTSLAANRLVRAMGEHGKERTVVIGGLEGPVGMVSRIGRGEVYVTEAFAGVVSLIGTNGEKTIIAKDLKMPEGIARAADGRLMVAEVGAKHIIEINPQNGTVTEIAGQSADRLGCNTRRAADRHTNRRRHRRIGHDLLPRRISRTRSTR